MVRSAHALVLAGASIAAVAALGFLSLQLFRGYRLTRPYPSTISPEAEQRARRALPGLSIVSLRTSDGLTLRGYFAPGRNRGVVIFVHGGGGNRLALLPEASVIAAHGYGVLLFDSRGEGESDGRRVTWGDLEQRDVFAALDFVTGRPEVDPARVGVLGFSIGGSTVALAAARDARARAVILYATWSSLEEELQRAFGRFGWASSGPVIFMLRVAGVDPDNVRPLAHVSEISPRPLLLVAGTADNDTPLPVMERLFAAAGEPKQLWVVPGAGHGGAFALAPQEYAERVIGFLDRALLPAVKAGAAR